MTSLLMQVRFTAGTTTIVGGVIFEYQADETQQIEGIIRSFSEQTTNIKRCHASYDDESFTATSYTDGTSEACDAPRRHWG